MNILHTSNYKRRGGCENAFAISVSPPQYFKGDSLAVLAPTWGLVQGYKNGTISKDEYTLTYTEIIESRKNEVLQTLHNLPNHSYLLCYESPSDFCHRHVLAAWIEKNTGILVTEWKNPEEIQQEKQNNFVDSLLDF